MLVVNAYLTILIVFILLWYCVVAGGQIAMLWVSCAAHSCYFFIYTITGCKLRCVSLRCFLYDRNEARVMFYIRSSRLFKPAYVTLRYA
jgi:hypothetical protein